MILKKSNLLFGGSETAGSPLVLKKVGIILWNVVFFKIKFRKQKTKNIVLQDFQFE